MVKKQRNRSNINAFIIILIIIGMIAFIKNNSKQSQTSSKKDIEASTIDNNIIQSSNIKVNAKSNKDLGWELTLVNKDNELPEDYQIPLKSIDEYRKFDSRAIQYLNKMIADMRNDGITNIWVQSAYRSVEDQTRIFNNKVEEYRKQGKSLKKAEELTELTINRPRQSEHNLGLAVDFNYVDYSFDETLSYNWLVKNAEKYGFVLRYAKDKESITKVKYEPWHWRYVGKENAKKMNELGLCLEEYVEYLSK